MQRTHYYFAQHEPGTPADIGNAVAMLFSKAAFIMGETIDLDEERPLWTRCFRCRTGDQLIRHCTLVRPPAVPAPQY
jgi:hypothetical protein